MRGTQLISVVSLGTLAAALAATVAAAPSRVALSLDGVAGDDSHHGTFAAPPPVCPNGTFVADGNGIQTGRRTFTCADGSGTFIGAFNGQPVESDGGSAQWRITGGTGRYTNLRGVGQATVVITSPGSPPQFHATWQGLVDFDAVPPALAQFSGRTTRAGVRYRLTLALGIRDNVASNPVTYDVLVYAGSGQLGRDLAGNTTGRVTRTTRITPPRTARSLRIVIDLRDPVGNEATFTRRVRLP